MEFLFKEHSGDFDPARRSLSFEWILKYLESFRPAGNEPAGRVFEMKSEGAALIAIGQRQLDSGRPRGDQRIFGVLPKAQARKRLGSSTL